MKAIRTLLLLRHTFGARLDVARDNTVVCFTQHINQGEDPDKLETIRQLLSAKAPARKTWILDDSVFSKSIELPTILESVEGDKHRNQMLAFELEPYSGIEGLKAVVGYQELESSKHGATQTWAVEMEQEELDQMKEVVKTFKTRLVALSTPLEGPHASFSLTHEDQQALQVWMLNRLEKIEDDKQHFPWIIVAQESLSTSKRALILGMVVLVGILGFIVRDRMLDKKLVAMQQELSSIRDPAGIRNKIQRAQADLAALHAYGRRWPSLMRLISENFPEDMILTEFSSSGEKVKLTGLTLEPELPGELVAKIETFTPQWGWEAKSPRKKARELRRDGGPWDFTIELIEIAPQVKTGKTESQP